MRAEKSGFTIIEVVLASLILVISLIGGAVFFSANRKNLAYASCERLAMWAAIYRMEQLKSASYTGPGVCDPILNDNHANPTVVDPLPIPPGAPYRWRTSIQDMAGGDSKLVTVSVDWSRGDWSRQDPQVSLTTILAPRPQP